MTVNPFISRTAVKRLKVSLTLSFAGAMIVILPFIRSSKMKFLWVISLTNFVMTGRSTSTKLNVTSLSFFASARITEGINNKHTIKKHTASLMKIEVFFNGLFMTYWVSLSDEITHGHPVTVSDHVELHFIQSFQCHKSLKCIFWIRNVGAIYS